MDQETGLYDIYGLWHVPFWQKKWFIVACILFLFLIMSIIAWRIIAKRRARKQYITYWDRALAQLDALLDRSIENSQECYHAYNMIVSILKEYLALRYHGSAPAMTDDELLIFLAGTSCPSESLQLLEKILKEGLEIRFAGQHTYKQIVAQAVNAAIVFIKTTLPESNT